MAYKVLAGLTYGGKRAEAGDIVDDIPGKSVPWLVEQGLIEKTETKSAKREPESPSKGDE